MIIVKKDLKRSLSLVLAFMLSISGVDIEALADTESVDTTRIDQTLGISATFFDTDVDKDDDGVCEYGEAYGLETTSSVTIPMSLGDTVDFSDYALSNISSVILRSETDNIEVSLEEIKVWGNTLPLENLMSDKLVLGYYSINYLNDFCNALFEEYLRKEGVSTLDKDAVKKSAEDFLSNSKEYSLIINYDTGERTFSLDTEIYFVNYEYYNSHESSTSRTTITDLVYSTEVESGKVPKEYTIPIYGSGMEAGAIISVPTSKTIEDNTFYDVDSNSIFTVKEGDIYNTYYVDVESEDAINFPLKGMSTATDVVNVKFDDNTVYDSAYSIKLNSTTNLDADSLGKKFYVKIKSPKIDNGEGVQLYSVDELLEILIDAGISRLQYEGKIYDLNDIDLSQFDSIADFLNNAQVPYISDICALDGSEYKGVDGNGAKALLNNNFVDMLSAINSADYDGIDLQGRIVLKDVYKSTDFKDVKSKYIGCSAYAQFYSFGELGAPNSTRRYFSGGDFSSDSHEGSSYSRSEYSNIAHSSAPLLRFYTYTDFELPEKYKSTYFATSDSFVLEPNFDKINDSILELDTTKRVIKVPTYHNKTKSFCNYLKSLSNSDILLLDSKYNNSGFFNSSSYQREYNNYALYDLDGFIYISFDGYNVSTGANSISDDDLLELLNTYYSCNFETMDDLYNSDYFANYSYKFEVPNTTGGLSTYKSKVTSCYASYSTSASYWKLNSENNTTEIYVPWYNIYTFMLSEASRYMYDYFESFGIKCKAYQVSPGWCIADHEDSILKSTDSTYYYDNDIFITRGIIGSENFSKLNYAHVSSYYIYDTSNVCDGAVATRRNGMVFSSFKQLATIEYNDLPFCSIRALQFYNALDVVNLPVYWEKVESVVKNIKTSVKNLEAAGIEIDYENSYIPDINNLSYEPLSTFIELIPFKEAKKQYSSSNLVKSVSTNNIKKTSSVVTGGGVSISPDSYTAKAGDTASVFMQVRSTIKDWGEHSDGKCLIKNTYISDYVEAYDSDVLGSHTWLTNNTSFSEYEHKNITSSNIGTYIDYKFGNLIFASRPSVVQDLAIDSKGNVIWDKSVNEGLGVDADGNSKSDDIVKLESYTLYVSDKDGNKLYTDTVTPSEAHDSALKTPVVSPSSIVVTQSAVKAKAFRKMSTVTPVSDALFTIPDEYNVAGNIITVYATNVLGDSDEVSITIPAKATPTPVPTATPTSIPTATPTPVPTVTPTPVPTPTKAPTEEPTKVPTSIPTSTPTAEPTKAPIDAPTPTAEPTKAPTKAPTPTVEPTKVPTSIPTSTPTEEPTKAPTPVPEYNFTIKDVYHNDDGTTEVKERENVRIKEGEPYSFSALDSNDYIPRVPKYEGIASKDTEIIFDYDEKEKRVTLQGYVTYSNGKPIKGKLIEISGKETKSDITDSKGFYSIDNVLVGSYNYTLYNSNVAGSGILAKCDIRVTKKNGTVEVKYTDDNCKVDYASKDGVLNVNAKVDEPATPVPTHTSEPTKVPTSEPTKVPTSEPTKVPTSEPTKVPTVVPTTSSVVTGTPTPAPTNEPTSKPTETPIVTSEPTKKPKVTQKPTKKPSATVEPTKKPKTTSNKLVQTGMYSNNTYWGILFLVAGLGIIVVSFKRKK